MYSYPALIPTRYQDRGLARRMRELEPSCSGFEILLGVKGDFPELAHHNVFFSRDYSAEFRGYLRRRHTGNRPYYLRNLSLQDDPTQAPPGNSPLRTGECPGLPPEHSNDMALWKEWAAPYRNDSIAVWCGPFLPKRRVVAVFGWQGRGVYQHEEIAMAGRGLRGVAPGGAGYVDSGVGCRCAVFEDSFELGRVISLKKTLWCASSG